MFESSTWFSPRMHREATLNRWGHFGQPVLVFPTAGGDAGEIDRFHLVRACGDLVDAGKIKIYSCDSVAGMAMMMKEGSVAHRMWMLNQFHQYVRHEVVPAIWRDCGGAVPIWTAGASIGAFHAAATVCRFPDVFHKAAALSGTYDILRFIHDGASYNADFFVSSPVHFLPGLSGPHLDEVRKRFILIASGEGRAENIGESWHLARVLGNKRIPNYVDNWGPEWPHDWQTWRAMLPKFLTEWIG